MAKTDSIFNLARSILVSIETGKNPGLDYFEWLETYVNAISKPISEELGDLLLDADCVMQAWLMAP